VVVALHQNIFLAGWWRFTLHTTQKLVWREVVLKNLNLDQIVNFEHKLVWNHVRFGEVESTQWPLRIAREEAYRVI
jgi:hypothetical protein